MPLYVIRCTECGKKEEIFLRLKEYQNLPTCCDVMMVRVITPINVMDDLKPYKSMVTGEIIGSRSTHKRHLIQHNVIEVGNEKLPPPKPYGLDNREKDELRRDIAQIMDAKI